MKKEHITLNLFLETEVRDSHNKLLSKNRMVSHSLVTAFMGILRAFFINTSTIKDIGGTNRGAVGFLYSYYAPTRYYSGMNLNAPTTDSTFGIQVGTDSTGVTNLDYKLGTKIAHGSGTGTLLYNSTSVEDVAGEAPVSSIRVIRTFSNSSGSSITVREIGVAAYNGVTVASQYVYLIVRDVPTEITVPNGSTLTIRYLFVVTA